MASHTINIQKSEPYLTVNNNMLREKEEKISFIWL